MSKRHKSDLLDNFALTLRRLIHSFLWNYKVKRVDWMTIYNMIILRIPEIIVFLQLDGSKEFEDFDDINGCMDTNKLYDIYMTICKSEIKSIPRNITSNNVRSVIFRYPVLREKFLLSYLIFTRKFKLPRDVAFIIIIDVLEASRVPILVVIEKLDHVAKKLSYAHLQAYQRLCEEQNNQITLIQRVAYESIPRYLLLFSENLIC